MENVIAIWEGMEWTRCLGLDAMLIKIDFKKAHDRVEWMSIILM